MDGRRGRGGPHDIMASGANFLNGVAGVAQLGTAFLKGSNQTNVAYLSAAT